MGRTNTPDAMQAQISALNEFIGAHQDMQILLDHSAAWADSRMAAEQTSRRTAWRVAFGLGGLTLIAFFVAASPNIS
jgi:type IV secretion system protein VirB8